MPVAFNPFNPWTWLSASTKPATPTAASSTTTTSPAATPMTPTTPTTAPSSRVTQAGLFATDGLIGDARLNALRKAAPVQHESELSTSDPKDKRVVYKQVSGRGVRLNHGSVIEGSVDFGGLQPNYVVDLKHPRCSSCSRRPAPSMCRGRRCARRSTPSSSSSTRSSPKAPTTRPRI